jgi:hypothetical protein
MRSSIWMGGLAASLLAFAAACSGFSSQCSSDADCAATSYCNPTAQACFGRSGGAAVPVIDTVTVGPGANQITVAGTATPTWTVNVFTNATCTGTPAGTGSVDSSGSFSVQGTAPSTGTVYATAEGGSGGSICSLGKNYP